MVKINGDNRDEGQVGCLKVVLCRQACHEPQIALPETQGQQHGRPRDTDLDGDFRD